MGETAEAAVTPGRECRRASTAGGSLRCILGGMGESAVVAAVGSCAVCWEAWGNQRWRRLSCLAGSAAVRRLQMGSCVVWQGWPVLFVLYADTHFVLYPDTHFVLYVTQILCSGGKCQKKAIALWR
eukprot:scaffold175754_cov17-Tisochrysis_lutea.AAC.1